MLLYTSKTILIILALCGILFGLFSLYLSTFWFGFGSNYLRSVGLPLWFIIMGIVVFMSAASLNTTSTSRIKYAQISSLLLTVGSLVITYILKPSLDEVGVFSIVLFPQLLVFVLLRELGKKIELQVVK